MRLIQVLQSKQQGGMARVTGLVEYNDGATEEYWFQIPDPINLHQAAIHG